MKIYYSRGRNVAELPRKPPGSFFGSRTLIQILLIMENTFLHTVSVKIRNFFHDVSEIRPLVWICIYLAMMPLFGLIYWALPVGQFRIPEGSSTDFGSWLYYSIVTITTLGFGDYTPAAGWAQALTSVEVMLGLSLFGFFLNAVASLKGDVAVESELERQRQVHLQTETDRLRRNLPVIIHKINLFMAYCYVVTTPVAKRGGSPDIGSAYNPDFSFNDMRDLFKPSGLPSDFSSRPAIESLVRCARSTSLYIDSLQTHIDLALWPSLLESCFAFVAQCQMLSLENSPEDYHVQEGSESIKAEEERVSGKIADWKGVVDAGDDPELFKPVELYHFIMKSAKIARQIETEAIEIVSEPKK